MPQTPWRNWYHCTVSTYGTWLPGDPRGWRERDHHEHIEGDYKHPPKPSNFNTGRHNHSKRLLRFDPYHIAPPDRETIGRLLLESLEIQKISLLSLAVCENNFHALIQCHNRRPKPTLGQAKKHVTFRFAPIINEQTKERRPIWEGEGGAKPINDEAHARNAYQYILDHIHEGGWTWSYKDAK